MRKELLRDDKKPFKLGLNTTFVAVFIVYCHLPPLYRFYIITFLSSVGSFDETKILDII